MTDSATVAPVLVDVADGVATIRLNRPQRRNALDMPLTVALAEAIESTHTGDVGAIALLGAGEHFCVGGDVTGFGASPDATTFVSGLADAFHRVVRAARVAPPVVAGLRGWAAGAGMSLLLACDVVVAGQTASMRPAYPGIGLTPDGGMSWTLPRAVGERLARAILLQDEALGASRAYALGVVDHVVPDDAVESETLAIAQRLANGPREALHGIKRLVAAAEHDTLTDHLDAESASIGHRAGSAEGGEGVRAFVERRTPDFTTTREVH